MTAHYNRFHSNAVNAIFGLMVSNGDHETTAFYVWVITVMTGSFFSVCSSWAVIIVTTEPLLVLLEGRM
jgi:hypothetical protein